VAEVIQRVQAYFAGKRVEFGAAPLDLEWCTPFQRAVADTLRAVPYGEVVTYGELAALAGHPNAQRAAGTFCAHNRLPIFLPCHRVVAAGGIGSYGSLGTEYKRRLLELEHAAL
jgi:methylated-DNA-[protein]-cysteine S-methyltransferase